MTPLSRQGAEYFCKGFNGQATQPPYIRDLYDSRLDKKRTFKESDPEYELYRDALLREADRSFFLAVSCFRRSLSLFTPSCLFWAHVSLYYSSWFAAQSILAIFGCWVRGPRGRSRIVIESDQTAPGNQAFRVEKNYQSFYPGTHQFFWDAYYRAMSSVAVWADPELQLAVTPVGGNRTWAIDRRNDVNYMTHHAFKIMADNIPIDFPTFPACLKGDVITQFQLARALILFCAQRAVEFGLKTDAHSGFSTRADAIRDLIYKAIPGDLSAHSEEANLTV